jgi:hypothetical protein
MKFHQRIASRREETRNRMSGEEGVSSRLSVVKGPAATDPKADPGLETEDPAMYQLSTE